MLLNSFNGIVLLFNTHENYQEEGEIVATTKFASFAHLCYEVRRLL